VISVFSEVKSLEVSIVTRVEISPRPVAVDGPTHRT